MDLKRILGDIYKDEMTAEELKAAIEAVELPQMIEKSKFDKTASEAAEFKRLYKELETSKLSESEKLAKQLEEAEATKAQYQAMMRGATIRETLAQAGFPNEKLAQSLIENTNFVSDDSLKSVVNSLIDTFKGIKGDTEKRVKAEVLMDTPAPPPSAGEPSSRDRYDKMNFTERAQFKIDHPEEYKAMMES